jgi:preprotein translocase subunit SecD
VAAPVKQRPGRMISVVILAIVALYLGVFLGPASTPALGLDLRGGTEVTLTAHPIAGGKVTKSALSQAVDIIRSRANGLGVGGADVNTQGSDNIVVSVPGKGHDQVVKNIGQTALLRFRQALALENPAPTPVTTASPSANPSPSASLVGKGGKSGKGGKAVTRPSPKSSKSSKSSGDAISSVLRKHTSTPSPTPSTALSPSPTVTPTPTTSPTVISETPSPGPSALSGGDAGNTTTPLKNSESRTLTPAFEKAFTNWNCTKKKFANPTRGADDPLDYIIACATDGTAKYLLAPAAVEGTQVSSATANLDSSTGTQWVVDINFNGSGSSAWQKVTAKAYSVNGGKPQTTACSPPTGCNSVAIVLDGVVQSAPYISTAGGIPGGNAQISGSFTQTTANDLANILKYGALPLKFTQSDVQSVSATLGAAQLHGGLIAGAIGLGLVIVFSLLYYRALGLVTVGSLAVSGLILYAVTTLLGHSSIGYTLSLPGIAGFIVAVGITADSFVVFFERLRDEIREGRRLRSGVERAWPRARRTILSADTVSLLAAVILYIVSIGDVRGFAFTLGLSTLSDLFIVFFFTKPLLQILAKVKAFDTGKTWTGVGKARAGVVREVDEPARPARPARPSRTREA